MKRSTETVLRDELRRAASNLAAAIRKRDEAEERARVAKVAVDKRKALVAYAVDQRERARKALEAILGRPLTDDELVETGFLKPEGAE